jgi:hypothetical protein
LALLGPAVAITFGPGDARHLDQEVPGHPAGAVYQHGLARRYRYPVVPRLVGRKGGDGKTSGPLERDRRRQPGRGGGRHDELLRPGALITKWGGVDQDPVAYLEPTLVSTGVTNYTRGLHAERHRRLPSKIPAADQRNLIPVPDSCRPNIDQKLVRLERARVDQIQKFDLARKGLDPGSLHPTQRSRASGPTPQVRRPGRR